VGVKLAAQFRDLLADAFELRVGVCVAGQVAQLFDVFFEALDFLLAFRLLRMIRAWCSGFGFVF
jgi:hypothetical protein